MDWLRVGAFALLILYHVGMYFVPWDWHVKAAHADPNVAILMLATNSGWPLPLALPNLAAFAILVAATAAGSWTFYLIGRAIPWLRPLIGLAAKEKGRPEGRPSPTAQ